jgi:hypothetical protein
MATNTLELDVSRAITNSLELHESIIEAISRELRRPRSMVNRWVADALAGYQYAPNTPAYLAAKAYSEAWERHGGEAG